MGVAVVGAQRREGSLAVSLLLDRLFPLLGDGLLEGLRRVELYLRLHCSQLLHQFLFLSSLLCYAIITYLSVLLYMRTSCSFDLSQLKFWNLVRSSCKLSLNFSNSSSVTPLAEGSSSFLNTFISICA